MLTACKCKKVSDLMCDTRKTRNHANTQCVKKLIFLIVTREISINIF